MSLAPLGGPGWKPGSSSLGPRESGEGTTADTCDPSKDSDDSTNHVLSLLNLVLTVNFPDLCVFLPRF